MKNRQKRGMPVSSDLGTIPTCGLRWCVGNSLHVTVTVSGSATLPNGAIVDIAGACDMSETPGCTEVNFAGRNFEFTKSSIVVDGVEIGEIDDSIKRLTLRVDCVPFLKFFSLANGVVLTANGKEDPVAQLTTNG